MRLPPSQSVTCRIIISPRQIRSSQSACSISIQESGDEIKRSIMVKTWMALTACFFVAIMALKYDETCKSSDECFFDLQCIFRYQPCLFGRCLCSGEGNAFSSVHGRCYKKVLVGERCMLENAECAGKYSKTICSKGKCVCKKHLVVKPDKLSCQWTQDKFIGESCSSKDNCFEFNPKTLVTKFQGSCSGKKCVCTADLKINGTQCLKKKVGDKCEKNTNCGEYQECNKNKCNCWENYVFHPQIQICVKSKNKEKGNYCNYTHTCRDNYTCMLCPGGIRKSCLEETSDGTYLYKTIFGLFFFICLIFTCV